MCDVQNDDDFTNFELRNIELNDSEKQFIDYAMYRISTNSHLMRIELLVIESRIMDDSDSDDEFLHDHPLPCFENNLANLSCFD